jgi:hypothetical protein
LAARDTHDIIIADFVIALVDLCILRDDYDLADRDMDNHDNATVELDHLPQPQVIAEIPSFKPCPATEVGRKLSKNNERLEEDANLAVSDPGLFIARNTDSHVEVQPANANNHNNVSRISDGHPANHGVGLHNAINAHDEQGPSRSQPPIEMFPETEG